MNGHPYFSQDIFEFLYLLSKHKVKYLIVGGEAVIYYGHARLTGDIDIFYELSDKNVNNLFSVLEEFWDHNIPGIKNKSELIQTGMVFQFGVPPNRIDILNVIEGIQFKEAWINRKEVKIETSNKIFNIYYIGLKELIKNKEAVGRFKDKDDLNFLYALKNKKSE